MNHSHLEIDQSPSSITPKGKFASKKPYIIVAMIIFLFIIGMIYATAQRGDMEKQEEKDNNTIKSDNTKIDKLLNSLSKITHYSEKNNTIIRQALYQPKQQQLPPLKAPKNQDLTERQKEILAIKKMKQKAFIQAVQGDTKISTNNQLMKQASLNQSYSTEGNGRNKNILDSYLKNYDKINHQQKQASSSNTLFQDKGEMYLNHSKQKPRSPYELKTGSLIPAVLIGGINSELPGKIIAQVRESVYDTATGNHLLIPQGSKLIGVYGSQIKHGQNRVMIAFNRVVFPNGQALNIGAMNGIDQEGYSGFEDQVDNHYFKIFGSAFLLGMLSGEINIENSKVTFVSGHQGFNTSQTVLEQTAGKMISKNLNIAPTIKIRSGYRFNIFVTKDMILEPLKQSR